LTHFSKNF